MKRGWCVGLLPMTVCIVPSWAQEHVKRLDEVVVRSQRPMKDIGLQKTMFDSITLKESIALSMADILIYNSSLFVKSYGRATLSTVAFRGTSPSHTSVTWNGLSLNSPMLGMTDFSTIPSFFVDKASLLHGSSSIADTGGALGGLVKLSTGIRHEDGLRLQYVQGIGSFSTFDEFLRLSYGTGRVGFSTRAVYSSSPNDFRYVNHDKKVNIYDDDRNIIGQYHPVERNRSGAFNDFHLLQEFSYSIGERNDINLAVWFTRSDRELPLLTSDYGDERQFENKQLDRTLRATASWIKRTDKYRLEARGGYLHTSLAYDYRREVAEGNWAVMTRSRSYVNTYFGQADLEFHPTERLYLTADVAAYQHFVRSKDKNVILQEGGTAIVGYDKGRFELSGTVSARWQPSEPLGLSFVVREERKGERTAPPVPAFFADLLVWKPANLMLKGSMSRNYKFPTLNDLYFLPGGNPNLKNESGWSYDGGMSYEFQLPSAWEPMVSGNVTWFDSRIDDWIIWLPTTKGFFSPRNIKRVHTYGVENRLNVTVTPADRFQVALNASYSWTPSINLGEKLSEADQSVGKQLPYIPLHSASFTGRVAWRAWGFTYKWAYYSQRYTMSSNAFTFTGHLPEYFMSNIVLERNLSFRPLDLQLKLAVNNLLNEDYLSVLSRPMPGINFEFFITFTPKF